MGSVPQQLAWCVTKCLMCVTDVHWTPSHSGQSSRVYRRNLLCGRIYSDEMLKCFLCLSKQIKNRNKKTKKKPNAERRSVEISLMWMVLWVTLPSTGTSLSYVIFSAEIFFVMLKAKLETCKEKKTAPKPALYVSQFSATISSLDYREQDNRLLYSTVPSEHTRECSLGNRPVQYIFVYNALTFLFIVFIYLTSLLDWWESRTNPLQSTWMSSNIASVVFTHQSNQSICASAIMSSCSSWFRANTNIFSFSFYS